MGLASLRSMSRTTEVKMALAMNVVMFAIIGATVFLPRGGDLCRCSQALRRQRGRRRDVLRADASDVQPLWVRPQRLPGARVAAGTAPPHPVGQKHRPGAVQLATFLFYLALLIPTAHLRPLEHPDSGRGLRRGVLRIEHLREHRLNSCALSHCRRIAEAHEDEGHDAVAAFRDPLALPVDGHARL